MGVPPPLRPLAHRTRRNARHLEEARRTIASAPSIAKRTAPISVLDFHLSPTLSTIDIPVIVLVGDHDRQTSVSDARELTAALPHAELRIERGAGHFLVLERPDAFVSAVRDLRARS
ncbi:alpha/beta fold hydrolase [Thermasporomyces composti]|jgi:pimeloyl-ACP methyl ester carboxylesterase|uniref:alpha/beta fold hydrolase n=1 Tax=Thermasporomyces composti TaxID=696763 RepID=UPI000E259E99|nr:alpha/beta hydrolase [Thermasporomyces composti]